MSEISILTSLGPDYSDFVILRSVFTPTLSEKPNEIQNEKNGVNEVAKESFGKRRIKEVGNEFDDKDSFLNKVPKHLEYEKMAENAIADAFQFSSKDSEKLFEMGNFLRQKAEEIKFATEQMKEYIREQQANSEYGEQTDPETKNL